MLCVEDVNVKHTMSSETGEPSFSSSEAAGSSSSTVPEQETQKLSKASARERDPQETKAESEEGEGDDDDDDDDEEESESASEPWDNKCPIEGQVNRHIVDFPYPFWCTQCGGAGEQGKCKGVSNTVKPNLIYFLTSSLSFLV